MKKATLKYIKKDSMIFLESDDLTIGFYLHIDIQNIYEILSVDEGFFVVSTEYGEEFIDFYELLESQGVYTPSELKEIQGKLDNITLEDVELEVIPVTQSS